MSEPRAMLDRAREAVRAGDFALALTSYEWFFDHALDGDSASFYGVRLSYCLDEWQRLGEHYEPARLRLEARFHQALEALKRTRRREYFHDYVSIAHYLGRDQAVIVTFLAFHQADRALAEDVVHFAWDVLAESEHRAVCGDYVDDARAYYAEQLLKADVALQLYETEPGFGNADFFGYIAQSFNKRMVQLIGVLEAAGRGEEARGIDLQAREDGLRRGFGQ